MPVPRIELYIRVYVSLYICEACLYWNRGLRIAVLGKPIAGGERRSDSVGMCVDRYARSRQGILAVRVKVVYVSKLLVSVFAF